jgi:hypothetical protein
VFELNTLHGVIYIYVELTMKQFSLGIIAAIGLTLPAFGQSVDPPVGTWKMNVEKSIAVGIPPFQSLIQNYSGEGQNFIDTVDAVNNQGQVTHSVFRHIYDGVPHPTTGNPDYDSTAYTRIGNTINGVRFRQGNTAEVMQGVIVPGKTYTITAEGIAANGQPYHYVLVLERQ